MHKQDAGLVGTGTLAWQPPRAGTFSVIYSSSDAGFHTIDAGDRHTEGPSAEGKDPP